jgi:ubiquinone/menaquinone biosynthesis C-methylase UbiE
MIKQRKIETNDGIQDHLTVTVFDRFAKNMRDKGWNNIDAFIAAGIRDGNVLEIGCGPGYSGLEWLKQCPSAHLSALEISREMIGIAERNAVDYGFEHRVKYIEGNCQKMPFPSDTFDGVFSNGSLHEWEHSEGAFCEIFRVLKPGGIFCVTDLRRDISPFFKWLMYISVRPPEIRPGFLTSLAAAYTVTELTDIVGHCLHIPFSVAKEPFGLCVTGRKPLHSEKHLDT